jgi:hypothetical protein
MKKVLPFISLLLACFSFTLVSQAQAEEDASTQRIPRWISEKGYWVVESNVKTPYHSIIHFYNNDNVLVYREKVDGVKINLNRTRTKMRLKKVLEQSIVAWEKDAVPKENAQLVAKALREP